MVNFFKKHKYLIFILTLSLAIYYRWLSFSIFANGDYWFQFKDTLKEIPDFTTWCAYFGIGEMNIMLWRLMAPNSLVFGLFGYFGFNSEIADKILLIWPWVILSGICSFFLVKKITKSDIGGLIGSLVFSFNTYFLAINTQGHILLSTASVFATFSLLFFIDFIEKRMIYLGVLVGVFLFLTGINDLRILYITIFIIFFYYIFILFVNKKISFSNYKNTLKTLLPIFIVIMLNIFWISASLKAGSLSHNNALDRGLFGNYFLNITKSLTIFHPFWDNGTTNWFTVQKLPVYFWIIPLTAFTGLILNRKNKNIVFFGIISLIGIFLSKQVSEPFSDIYPWLFNHFPGFNAFREASKFYFLIVIGYSVLIGSFIAWIYENWNKKKWQIIGKYLMTFLISFIFIWNVKLIIASNPSTIFIPRYIPDDYLVFKNFLLKQPEYFRTSWTPTYSRWSVYLNNKPEISGVNIIQSEWKNFINYNNYDNSWPMQERLLDIYKKDFSNKLFDISSIKYIIIPLQDKVNDDDLFIYYGGNKDINIRQWYINEIDKINWLKKVDIGTKDLVVYENENYREHIYATKEPETIYKNISFNNITWNFINPTEYKISLKNIKENTYLNFSEKYHPDWSLRVGSFNWFNVLINKNYFIDKKYHIENDAKLNSFLIDPRYIKQNFSKDYYKENPDGSIDIELTLYFKPQSYFYLGLIISGITLLSCLGYLGWNFVRRKNKKCAIIK